MVVHSERREHELVALSESQGHEAIRPFILKLGIVHRQSIAQLQHALLPFQSWRRN